MELLVNLVPSVFHLPTSLGWETRDLENEVASSVQHNTVKTRN